MRKANNLAAIDIGTNALRLLVVRPLLTNGKFRIITRAREVIRLGSGITDMKRISQRSISQAIKVLQGFKAIAQAYRASIRAVATSAVREALNQQDFIRQVRKETGIEVDTVSGYEEARLIYLGILQALPLFSKKILLIDIGGGSTEFLVGEKRRILAADSLKIGAVRLTQRFFKKNKLSKNSIKECRKYIDGVLQPIVRTMRTFSYDVVVGSSGTMLCLAQLIRLRKGAKYPGSLNQFSFSKKDLSDIVGKLLNAKTLEQRERIPGLDSERADIIVSGALILEQIFKVFSLREIVVSEFALKEGLVFDTIENKHHGTRLSQMRDIRYQSIVHCAETFHYEKRHAQHTLFLALRIFDALEDLHGFGNGPREYLEAASLLHDIGFFISHSQHHRHSYYLIRNFNLLGFTEREKELIANIARYHRKSHPKKKHETFWRLPPEDRHLVRVLSAILRVADGLDRTHQNVVRNIRFQKRGKTITFILETFHAYPAHLEIWGAERKKSLFEDVFHVKVSFRQQRVGF